MSRSKDGDKKEPFISKENRPSPESLEPSKQISIHPDTPLSELKMSDLLEVISEQISKAITSASVSAFISPIPENIKPELSKPEGYKPELSKPEGYKPELSKPEGYKPEGYKGEQKAPFELVLTLPNGTSTILSEKSPSELKIGRFRIIREF